MEVSYTLAKYSGHLLWDDRESELIHFVTRDTDETLEQIRDFLNKGSDVAEAMVIVRRPRKETHA